MRTIQQGGMQQPSPAFGQQGQGSLLAPNTFSAPSMTRTVTGPTPVPPSAYDTGSRPVPGRQGGFGYDGATNYAPPVPPRPQVTGQHTLPGVSVSESQRPVYQPGDEYDKMYRAQGRPPMGPAPLHGNLPPAAVQDLTDHFLPGQNTGPTGSSLEDYNARGEAFLANQGRPAMLPKMESAYQQRAAADNSRFQGRSDYTDARIAARQANGNMPANLQAYGLSNSPGTDNLANQQDLAAYQHQQQADRMQGGMGNNWTGNSATGAPGLQRDVRAAGTPMYPDMHQNSPDTEIDNRRKDLVTAKMTSAATANRANPRTPAEIAAKAPRAAAYESPYSSVNELQPYMKTMKDQYGKPMTGPGGQPMTRTVQSQANEQAVAARISKNAYNDRRYDRGQSQLNSPYGLMTQAQQGETDRRNQAYAQHIDSKNYTRQDVPWMPDQGPGYNVMGPSAAAANAAAQYGPMSPSGVMSQRNAGQHDLGQKSIISQYAAQKGISLDQAIKDFGGAFGQGGMGAQQPGPAYGHAPAPVPGQRPPQQQESIPGVGPNGQLPETPAVNKVQPQQITNALDEAHRMGITGGPALEKHLLSRGITLSALTGYTDSGWLGGSGAGRTWMENMPFVGDSSITQRRRQMNDSLLSGQQAPAQPGR